ncbi:uncharacterized protein PV09_02727 [Verruconis gallopava]|uniref:Metallo-beta-lactamase domain-containing protein n=1 Tax=Verruconis gallopava TaxID=253628 RepID=A0A0D2AI37_9PEZI|nr:uncharacterized protein PV09_02727 [Verruconis gallopava]KIW06255.1 hypothetical protein PV09_02727 [Verruconis gallopava]
MSSATGLVELDSLEMLVIVDNELDPISRYQNEGVVATGNLADIAFGSPYRPTDRGPGNVHEVRMEQLCQSAHGLSILMTGKKDGEEHSMLFDVGPEEDAFERNATRLHAQLGKVEVVHLSHWHRDHSGGMLRAVKMINAAKGAGEAKVVVDLHPDRPDFRGVTTPAMQMSLEADPSFAEIESGGGRVSKNDKAHAVCGGFFMISGEIPRVTAYEHGIRRGARFSIAKGEWEKDELIKDERFVMCKVKDKGVIMFTGCSHAGVVNASKHAAELAFGTPLFAIVGGYHLADAEMAQIESSVRDLKALNVKLFLAGHCTGWKAKYEIERQMPGRLAPCTVGTTFTF